MRRSKAWYSGPAEPCESRMNVQRRLNSSPEVPRQSRMEGKKRRRDSGQTDSSGGPNGGGRQSGPEKPERRGLRRMGQRWRNQRYYRNTEFHGSRPLRSMVLTRSNGSGHKAPLKEAREDLRVTLQNWKPMVVKRHQEEGCLFQVISHFGVRQTGKCSGHCGICEQNLGMQCSFCHNRHTGLDWRSCTAHGSECTRNFKPMTSKATL